MRNTSIRQRMRNASIRQRMMMVRSSCKPRMRNASIRQRMRNASIRRRMMMVRSSCKPRMRNTSIRQRMSAYVSMRQDTSGYVGIRQHTPAYVSIRRWLLYINLYINLTPINAHSPNKTRLRARSFVRSGFVRLIGVSIRQHTSRLRARRRQVNI
jgi:hypothetical protein